MVGKNILITGSNSGIGKAVLEVCAKNGANIISHSRKQTEQHSEYLSQIKKKYNIEIIDIYFDLNNFNEIQENIKHILQSKIQISGLVNNAGMMNYGTFTMTKIETIEKLYKVNIFAQMLITQMVLKSMIKEKNGSIVNVSSINALDITPNRIGYSTSKAALLQFGMSLAAELSEYNIRVNNVAPGYTNTNMLDSSKDSIDLFIKQNNIIKRLANANEIAEAVFFLLSNKSSYITGQTIRIDGGIKHWI